MEQGHGPARRSRPELSAGTRVAGFSPRPEHVELPRPWRLMLTAGWNLAESLGLPVAGYLVGAEPAGYRFESYRGSRLCGL
jgi:hypothetical protein